MRIENRFYFQGNYRGVLWRSVELFISFFGDLKVAKFESKNTVIIPPCVRF